MISRWLVVVSVGMSGCFGPQFSENPACGPQGECPEGTQCLGGAICVDIDCGGHVDNDPCANASIENGVCLQGQCVAVGCGDATLVDGEQCDEGLSNSDTEPNACRASTCLRAFCGDGVPDDGEACDDRNNTDLDGCSADCGSTETCGNRVFDEMVGEQCDDGIVGLSSDGCSSGCRSEAVLWQQELRTQTARPMAFDAARHVIVDLDSSGFGSSVTSVWNGDRWTRRAPATNMPRQRIAHPLAYDRTRRRIVTIDAGETLRTTFDVWEWDGVDWELRTPATRPPRRIGFALTYDAERERVVMYGGFNEDLAPSPIVFFNDTWEWDGADWHEVTIAADQRPPIVRGTTLSYDADRKVIVMFGGSDTANNGFNPVNQTWEFDGTAWTRRLPILVPPARLGHVLTYDPVRKRTVMFGGFNQSTTLRTTFEWNGDNWTQVTTATVPPAGADNLAAPDAFAAYDEEGSRVVLATGTETWLYDGVNWRLRSSTTMPRKMMFHRIVADIARGTLVLFGGSDFSTGERLAETWLWNGASWTLKTLTTFPPARANHMMAYDPGRERVVVFGGNNGTVDLGDTWEWNGANWTQFVVSGPPAREIGVMFYDPVGKRVILFGGQNGIGTRRGDTWAWNGSTWTQLFPATSPPARAQAAATTDLRRKRGVMYGGEGQGPPSTRLDDTWEWDGSTWLDVSPVTRPEAFEEHAMAYDPIFDRVVMFAGRPKSNAVGNKAHVWDGTTWTLLAPAVAPPGRLRHAMEFDPISRGIVVFSGDSQNGNPQDTWRLYLDSPTASERCIDHDSDDDGLAGCADPDCYNRCDPECPPGFLDCDPDRGRCGDGICNPALETDLLCPQDC
jgi:cysteine-rich repeat protein